MLGDGARLVWGPLPGAGGGAPWHLAVSVGSRPPPPPWQSAPARRRAAPLACPLLDFCLSRQAWTTG